MSMVMGVDVDCRGVTAQSEVWREAAAQPTDNSSDDPQEEARSSSHAGQRGLVAALVFLRPL